ncbi:MAG: hypothetical protein KJ066_13310 [Acidobacteria bacterium]|nr:hypothetical protein [Acidobacteriota bacterium]
MRPEFGPSREVGGRDPLDARVLPRESPPAPTRLDVLLRSRAALGLAPAAAPAIVFVPLGMMLGPGGLNLLSVPVLAHASPLVSIGLAALGVFVGLGLGVRSRIDRRLFLASAAETTTTLALVAGVFGAWFALAGDGLSAPVTLLVVALAVTAAASSAGAAEISRAPRHQLATRIADLDDVLPIVVGGVLLGVTRDATPWMALALVGATVGLGLVVAWATWLLLNAGAGDAERIAFVAGMLLLIGGGAAYLGLSTLLAGMAAGLFWSWAPGGGHERLRGQLATIQHPVVVLVLILAGATISFSWWVLALTVVFVLARLIGKLAGGRLAARMVGHDVPANLGVFLVAPGVIGIAFALNVHQVTDPAVGGLVLAVVALGSLLSELLALWLLPLGADEP